MKWITILILGVGQLLGVTNTGNVQCNLGQQSQSSTNMPGSCSLGDASGSISNASTTANYDKVTAQAMGIFPTQPPPGQPASASSSAMIDETYAVGPVGPVRSGFLLLSALVGGGGDATVGNGKGSLTISQNGTTITFLGAGGGGIGNQDDCYSCWYPVTLGAVLTFDLSASASAGYNDMSLAWDGSGLAEINSFQFYEADKTTPVAALVDVPEPQYVWVTGLLLAFAFLKRSLR